MAVAMNGAEPDTMTMADLGSPRSRAFAAYHRGDADAAGLIANALGGDAQDGGLLIADATLALEDGRPDPLARLAAMVAAAPDWIDGQVALARLRWESGARDAFLAGIDAALRRMPRHAGLWLRRINLLAESGDPLAAADTARQLRREGDVPALRLIEARHAGAAGDIVRAAALLDGLPDDLPGVDAERARQRLREGDPAASLSLLDRARAADPDDRLLWALSEVAWRATGDPRHGWLLANQAMIRAVPLALDQAERADAIAALRLIHARRWMPMGQSVRGGTQTRGDLRQRHEPALARLFVAIDDAVAAHLSVLPPLPPDHPVHGDGRASARMTASWSIRITGGGHHVAHVHPGGRLSSALHLVVPAPDAADPHAGALELGRPPLDIAIALDPVATIIPVPGTLVLFPSYLFHGTRPFGIGERMSVAFDIA